MPPRKAKAKARVRAAPKAAAAKPASPIAKISVPLKTLSALLMLTPQRVNQIERDGWIPKTARNEYALGPAIQGYLRFMKDDDRRKSKSAEAARVQAARAHEIELRNEQKQGRLIDYEDVTVFMSEALGTYRAELDGLPAACTRDLELRAVIDKQLNDCISRVRAKFQNARDKFDNGKSVILAMDPDF